MSLLRLQGKAAGRPGRLWPWGLVVLSLCGVVGLVGSGEAQWFSTDSRVLEPLPHGHVNWTDGVILGRDSATGTLRPKAGAATSQAATQLARQRVHMALMQVRLDARQTLGERLGQGGDTPQSLAALATRAEVVAMRYGASGEVEATVQVAMAGPLTALVLPPGTGIRPENEPRSEAVHSGIVIDARGLAIQPALFPRLVDAGGQLLYAPEVVETEAAVQQGYVAYAKAFDQPPAQARIGERPLVLRALRVVDAARVDLVLSEGDAARLREYAATRRLLQQCRVLIVM